LEREERTPGCCQRVAQDDARRHFDVASEVVFSVMCAGSSLTTLTPSPPSSLSL